MSQRVNCMSFTLLWILQSERVEVKILFVQDILSPISDCQKGNLLHLWVCSSYTQFHSGRSNVWGGLLFISLRFILITMKEKHIHAQNSLQVSYILYCSRIEVSLFLIFYLLNAPFPGMFLKISETEQDAWKKIITLKSEVPVHIISVCTWKHHFKRKNIYIVWLSSVTEWWKSCIRRLRFLMNINNQLTPLLI